VKAFPKIAAAIILVVTGLAAAFALARPAQAWDVNHLPATFHVTHEHRGGDLRRDYYDHLPARRPVRRRQDGRDAEDPLRRLADVPAGSRRVRGRAVLLTRRDVHGDDDRSRDDDGAGHDDRGDDDYAPPVTDDDRRPAAGHGHDDDHRDISGNDRDDDRPRRPTTTTTTDVTAELAKLQAEIDALSARVTVLETKTGLVAVGPAPSGYAPSGIEYQT
jgi:hypothetical protein